MSAPIGRSQGAPDLDRALEVARAAAARASKIALEYFRRPIEVERKADASPVTEADRECERAIRATLLEAFPEHAIYGEEYGHSGQHRCLWLVDPIDGTRSFIRGLEFWSVQIALMVDGELVLGVSSAPPFGETAWAVSGRGAWLDDVPLAVGDADSIDRMDLSLGNVRSLARSPAWSRIGQLVERASRTRGYGDFYPYHRLAAGRLDAIIESDVNILDIAALTVIVREAGGVVTDLSGAPIGLESGSVLAATPLLHPRLLSFLND
ncbi:MAG: inositol-phosphate phosphatase [Gammaproteobacteria bacterium HGW-Gammaproteobacteria-8]|nr:MAG: inositol-phosphate phosphatase [Gammaproteobacteria bacterium HGW-Gammaproteobacteria-8]